MAKKVMISSTTRDLPEHRERVMHACQRLGVITPRMMEFLTASTLPPLEVSLEMVDESDLYVGVFGYRYGTVPPGQTISITEAECNRAVKNGTPRLIFLMSDKHPVLPSDVETGEGAATLENFKERLKEENTVAFFDSPEDLYVKVFQALSENRDSDTTKFHYVSDIPEPPEKYVAHPYTLLQTHRLVGRHEEINLLSDWVGKPNSDIYQAHILSIVAIGGMGKSALTWKWFNDIAPQEMKPIAGRMWWSFYESDATFENFVIRALAYISKRPVEEFHLINPQDRESQLLAILDREPFLIILDGLERLLIAYARMDANRLEDREVGNNKNLRKTADPRVGRFLRKLAQVGNSRILISTRLEPAELEIGGGGNLPGTFRLNLESLNEEDAVTLWRSLEVPGLRDTLVPVFNAFGRHPLLIQALAGEVKSFRKAPGDFEKWRKANPRFDPAKSTSLQDAMGHVLESALRGLNHKSQQVLRTIAAFRMPVQYDTLASLLIGKATLFARLKNMFTRNKSKPCVSEIQLDKVLTELDDRGLVGWDKQANRYDLHPIVRGVVWNGLGEDTRQGLYTNLHAHFESVPMTDDWQEVNSLEDLTPAIELYNTLIGMERYEEAYLVFRDRLSDATLYKLSASRQRIEMLEMLFPDGLDELPCLRGQGAQTYILDTLATVYAFSGQPGRAALLYRLANTIDSGRGDHRGLSIGLCNLADTLRITDGLRESEDAALRALLIGRGREDRLREAISLYWLGLTLAVRGEAEKSGLALRRSLDIFQQKVLGQWAGVANSYLAQRASWFGEYAEALQFANCAWEFAHIQRFERDFINAARVQGEAALGLDDCEMADERLHHALMRARAVNQVEQELPALTALAELRRRRGDENGARELLDDVWEFAERGPYPLFHADALNVLAQIERDAGNTDKAIEAATKAYELSWCDGPPYAYHWGLEKAQKHLEELGAPLPEMEPFDESKFEPMPEVEIDPEDEFHVGDSSPS